MRSLVLTLLLVLLSGPVLSANNRPFVDEAEAPTPSSINDEDAAWTEGATTLPPWPKDGDLVEFQVDDPSSRFRQYIDGKNIRIGADAAVRYTLVVEAPSGVRNVSFEGLRCTPAGAYKIYAYGNNGRFEKTEGEWQKIHGRSHDTIHRDLHKLILCIPRAFEPRSKKDIIRAMRARVPVETNTGFIGE